MTYFFYRDPIVITFGVANLLCAGAINKYIGTLNPPFRVAIRQFIHSSFIRRMHSGLEVDLALKLYSDQQINIMVKKTNMKLWLMCEWIFISQSYLHLFIHTIFCNIYLFLKYSYNKTCI